MTRCSILLLLGSVLTACGGGGGGVDAPPAVDLPAPPPAAPTPEPVPPPAEPFTLDSLRDLEVDVHVRLDGAALPLAAVTVADALQPPGPGSTLEDVTRGGTYFQGATDSEGRVSASIRVPSRYDAVDVIVHRPGTTGPYTHEALRALWGPTATAARVALPLDGMPDGDVPTLTIELWSN